MSAEIFNIPGRRAAKRCGDARGVLDNIADGVAALDALVHSLAFCVIREEKIAAIEHNLQLLRGLCSELRAHVTPTEAPRS